jgi:hypothetical protein
VSATFSRPHAVLGLAAIVAFAACTEREIEVTPFRIEATIDGSPAPPGITEYVGVAALDGDRSLRVTSADGPVLAIAFSDAGGPDVRFPVDLAGRDVGVRVMVDEAHLGVDGQPLRVPAIQVIARGNDGFFTYRMLLGEATYATNAGLPALPVLFLPPLREDFPRLSVIADSLYFEPANCGLLYYDQIRVAGDSISDLVREETKQMALGLPPEWNVRNVVSWHRSGDCPGDVRAWTQVAMWR